MTPEQRRAQGIAAKMLLSDPTIKAAFEQVETDIHTGWAAAWTPRGREKLHAELRALQRIRSKLANMAGQAPRD